MFSCDIEVRYYETDMQGIVHHSNYLRYLEIAREKLIQKYLKMGSKDFEELGIFYVIRNASTTFLKPIRFADNLSVHVRIKEYNGLRLVHEYELRVGDEVCATAETTMVSIDKNTFMPLNMKKKHKDIHQKTVAIYEDLKNA